MSDLSDDLQEIDGVGPATADKILDVLDNHGMGREDSKLLEKARRAAENGNDRAAAVWLRRDE